MTPADLEAVVHRRLSALPQATAPRTLLPRIMAAVEYRLGRPWYRRALFTWPALGQVAYLVGVLVVLGGVAWWVPSVSGASRLSTVIGADMSSVAATAANIGAVLNAIEVLRRVVIEPLSAYAVGLVLVMCATSALFGAALARVALGGVFRS